VISQKVFASLRRELANNVLLGQGRDERTNSTRVFGRSATD
jgi:hypothetical protein